MVRISEMIVEKIQSGEKVTVDYMKQIQLDTLDVYVRENLESILISVERGF